MTPRRHEPTGLSKRSYNSRHEHCTKTSAPVAWPPAYAGSPAPANIPGKRRIAAALIVSLLSLVTISGTACTPQKATTPSQPTTTLTADLIILGGRIWTGTHPIDARPQPTALAVIGDRILAIGDDAAMRRFAGPQTKMIDARGRRIIPGITDSHIHIISGGFQLDRLQLRDVADRESFVAAIAEEATDRRQGQWILGGRWSVESWPNPESPTRFWIDPVTGDKPAFLSRMDGHQALVNSAALRLAGIDAAGPPDPVGGEIERHPQTREPTGILKESAMNLVRRLIPAPSDDERYEALQRAMAHANRHGITSIHDMSGLDDIAVFRRAEREQTLTLRITSYLQAGDWSPLVQSIPGIGPLPEWTRHIRHLPALDLNSSVLYVAGFKGYMDGSLGSRTAYMREPYDDATDDMPYPRGQLSALADSTPSFPEKVALADNRGLQLAVHAIGDEANHLLLNAYEAARQRHGRHDARHRVEHTQHLHLSDIPRFAALGVVASMQPLHKADDGRYAERAIGAERLRGSYAFRQLIDAGALVVFGSDWPVVSLDPFAGIDAAVNARTLAGDVWLPEHSLTVEEALRAYTVSPPRAIHREHRLGTLEAGKMADLVILDRDPFSVPSDQIGDIRPLRTILGGRTVFLEENQ